MKTIKIKADVVLVKQSGAVSEPSSECTGCIFNATMDLEGCQSINKIQMCDSLVDDVYIYALENSVVKEKVL